MVIWHLFLILALRLFAFDLSLEQKYFGLQLLLLRLLFDLHNFIPFFYGIIAILDLLIFLIKLLHDA